MEFIAVLPIIILLTVVFFVDKQNDLTSKNELLQKQADLLNAMAED